MIQMSSSIEWRLVTDVTGASSAARTKGQLHGRGSFVKEFCAFLVGRGVVSAETIERLTSEDVASVDPVYYRLLRKMPELEEPIWEGLAEFLGVELFRAESLVPDKALTQLMPARLAYELSAVPIRLDGGRLEIALADPRQFERCDEFALLLAHEDPSVGNLTVSGRLATPGDVAMMLRRFYGLGADTVQDVLDADSVEPLDQVSLLGAEALDLTGQEQTGEDAAIIRFVNRLMVEAVNMQASDIHLEPYENDLRVRYRVDGMLQTEPVPARIKHLEAAIISRIKVMAHMDIAEKRLPQDGQIRLTVMGRPIDARVSILPTMFGQGLALRLLDRQVAFRQLGSLGMPDDYLRLYRDVLELSHGVILVTGPTGSGKTTTLYASINEINSAVRKVVTVEDPIEYQLDGVSQIQVRQNIELTFDRMLRHVLRHDPDVIMVGEIRDSETARIAVSAAMTGHLVFSTLHTNDAPSAPVRLLEMGIEPYLVSSALEAVIAQRLIRVLCPECRLRACPPAELSDQDRIALGGGDIFEAVGCAVCRQSGYSGRTAIFELFTMNDCIRHLVLDRSDAGMIRQEALSLGMRTLRQSGLAKVGQGVTSLAEVYRVARDETVDMKSRLQ